MPHKPGFGAIFGIVSEEGLVKDNSPVVLVDPRRDADGVQRIIGRQLTRSDGGFEFAGLDTTYTDYMLLATDEDGVEPKNALIQDRVQPISARSGLVDPAAWYAMSCDEGAVVMLTGFPTDNVEPLRPYSPSAGSNWSGPQPEANLVLGSLDAVPNYAGIGIEADQCLVAHAVPYNQTIPQDVQCSLEVVFDMDSVVNDAVFGFRVLSSRASSSQYYDLSEESFRGAYAPLIAIKFDPLTKFLSGEISVSASLSILQQPFDGQGVSAIFSDLDLTAYSGEVHIIVTLHANTEYKVYVNGVQVSSGFDSNLFDLPDRDSRAIPALTVGGIARKLGSGGVTKLGLVHFGCTMTFVLATGYFRVLTAAQVQARYDALFDANSHPILTGIHKEIFQSYPLLVVPFDDSDITNHVKTSMLNGVAYLGASRSYLTGTSMANFTAGAISPVAGRNAITFVGGDVLTTDYSAPASAVFPREFALCVWVYFDAVNGTVQTIIHKEQTATSVLWLRLQLTASNVISLTLAEPSTPTDYVFAYTPPAGQWVFLAVDVDKQNVADPKAHLYVGDETSAPALTDSASVNINDMYIKAGLTTGDASIDSLLGDKSSHMRIGEGFTGRMSFLSLLPKVQGLTRWQEIWAAKDIV